MDPEFRIDKIKVGSMRFEGLTITGAKTPSIAASLGSEVVVEGVSASGLNIDDCR